MCERGRDSDLRLASGRRRDGCTHFNQGGCRGKCAVVVMLFEHLPCLHPVWRSPGMMARCLYRVPGADAGGGAVDCLGGEDRL